MCIGMGQSMALIIEARWGVAGLMNPIKFLPLDRMGTGMQLEQLIANRKSCRAFSDSPVDPQLLRSIIAGAARAPSNGNLQPWHIYILTGLALASLKQITKQQVEDQLPLQTPEYQVYPKPLKDIYDQRRQEIGEDLYRVLESRERTSKNGAVNLPKMR